MKKNPQYFGKRMLFWAQNGWSFYKNSLNWRFPLISLMFKLVWL